MIQLKNSPFIYNLNKQLQHLEQVKNQNKS